MVRFVRSSIQFVFVTCAYAVHPEGEKWVSSFDHKLHSRAQTDDVVLL